MTSTGTTNTTIYTCSEYGKHTCNEDCANCVHVITVRHVTGTMTYYPQIDGITPSVISKQKTADVVEVVRCKDCMYYKDAPFDVITNHDMVCAYAPLHHFYREPNDYCSKGERKEQK